MEDCIFCKFAKKELSKEFIYEDEDVMVFPDINPIKPIHLLIVPKKHIEDLVMMKDQGLMIKVMDAIQRMIRKQGLENKGYRLVVNGGGAQIINHLHFHLMGPMGKRISIA